VGVLVLVEWGELDLDEPVNDRLRSWRLPDSEHTASQPVTVRHLLSHTAGTTVPGFPGYAVDAPLPSVVDVLSGIGVANTPGVESFAPPGTRTQYSGGGTTIVQLLVTEVTGRPFHELMAELVLRPFGMVDSAYDQPLGAERRRRAAIGHGASGRPVPGGHHVYPELQAAGLWTTAVDLARWLIGVQEILRGDRTGPISRETAIEMITPLGDGSFGLGPELGGAGELRRFGHSGGNEGFRSQMDALVERPVGGVVLTNADNGTTLCAEVRRAFAAEYGWGELGGPAIELADVDPAVLASYAGTYEGPFGRPMKLRFDEGELFSPAPYGRRRMLPLGATTFLDEETGATLEVATEDGAVSRIAVLVDGNELMAFTPAGAEATTEEQR
jgi:CubicO group peptidase (beta-lactamase class C family)